ncbi:hypothetical protein BC833DRAFT_55263 [Globomyces pollinis-pini]|nr:hypothetical protein BC833DRAFT_55263 [Globomyces pollinis-pini]
MKLFNFSEEQDDPYNSIKGRPYDLSSLSSIQNYEMYDNQEMSNTEYELHKDNDRLPQNQSSANLIPINALNNSKFQSIFPYKCFNLIQSECFNECYNSDENMVVSGNIN